MIFSINNIGIIKRADVKVDGLTIISGTNNSGKTTVGKALYSVVSATEDLSKKKQLDMAEAVYNRIRTITESYPALMRFYENVRWRDDFQEESESDLVERIYYIGRVSYRGQESLNYYIDLLREFYQAVKNNTFLSLALEDINNVEKLSEESLEVINTEWIECKESVVKQCESALSFISSIPSTEEFAFRMIDSTLREEFSGQVQSMTVTNQVEDKSSLRLYDEGGKEYFNIYLDNHSVDAETSVFNEGYFKKGYFVDDPYIIEDSMRRTPSLMNRNRIGMSYTESTVVPHRIKMNRWLKRNIREERGISESLYKDKQIADVMEKINSIVPGNILGDTYVNDGRKIKVSNLATGSKVFSIIKNILGKGNIDEESLLVLDEPESHLHPKWINALAEVLVLLVKECNITVLLTTHSPNFLLAIDALMRKYHICEKCHFYQTQQIESDFRVEYIEKTDELDELYIEYARAFSKMNAMRKYYMELEED